MSDQLLFYCDDCDSTFESPPDGTGYEQAPCPMCGYVCMTVAFHEEERAKNRAGRAALMGLILPFFFSGYGFLVPLFCVVCAVGTEVLVEGITHDDDYYQKHSWPRSFALAAAGVLSLVVGRQLAARFEHDAAEAGGNAACEPPPVADTFFFIAMPLWGPILFVVSLVSLLARAL